MDMEKVVTGELDMDKVVYDRVVITLTDITPSQVESLVGQLKGFCKHPPKKDLIFDGAIRAVQVALSPKKEAELRLEHPDKPRPAGRPPKVGRPLDEDSDFNAFCSRIIEELQESPKTIQDLRRCLLPAISSYNPKYHSFHEAVARLKQKGVIKVLPDNMTLVIAVRGVSHGRS